MHQEGVRTMTTGDKHDQHADTDRATAQDTTEERLAKHKRLVRQALLAVGNDRNLTRVQNDIGFNNAIGRIRWLFTALPDARMTIDWQVAEGDQVVTGATFHGTHWGEWEGLPPTGKPVTLRAMFLDQVVDDKIVHHEALMDLLGALEQVGARLTLRPPV